MPSLRDLLEARIALPADLTPDGGTILVSSNLTGTLQLYRARRDPDEALEQLTDAGDPVVGQFVPGSGRILVEKDEDGNERTQLYLLDAEPGRPLEPLVHELDFIHRMPRLSHDGSLLAYACNRRNGVDFDVFLRRLSDGGERALFTLGGWCDPAGFSPDGRWLGVVRNTERSGDNDLHLVDVETGELVHASPHEEEAFFGEPAWLPDASAFLFATNDGRDRVGIARYELATRSWRYVLEREWDLQCAIDRGGRILVVEANEDGYSRLSLHDPETLELRRELELPGRGVASELVLSGDGRSLAYHFSSPLEPGDVWLHDVEGATTTRVTRSPSALRRDELAEPTLHRFASFDGESVPVFVYRRESDREVPVVIMIHGGPEAQLRPIFSPLAQYFVSHGYAVAAPNVRGSTGYGKRYEHLDDVHRRLDSVRDVVALHEWLGRPRAVLYGGSYGGYMVLACLAFHPDRWDAAIEIVGISSLVTFLENTAAWRRTFREREYGSLADDRDFLLEVSPLTHVERIRAPLFVIHGANDPRVPLGEAKQIHRVLSERGVPCELLVYEDEGHGLAKLSNRLDAYPRAIAFLERVLGEQSH